MTQVSAWQSEQDTAIGAAREAGRILLERAGRFCVRKKAVNDLVTDVDHAAQDAIRDRLGRQFPSDGFLGEEGADLRGPQAPRRWIVDPLDGTTNYVHGLPFFCVSIALEVDGQIVVGVVYDPVRRESFCAVAGGPATCNRAPIHVSSVPGLADALLAGGLPTDISKDPAPAKMLTYLSGRAQAVRRLGSAALSLAYVAAGRLDGFWSGSLNPWDAAAGILLIRQAGGMATNYDRSPHDLYTPDLAASNGLIHSALTEEIGNAREVRLE